MTCERANIGGVSAIVCTRTRVRRCKCGNRATRLCDWKIPSKKSGTCDAALCSKCSAPPAPEKDLCPKHAAQWQDMLGARE